MGNDYDKILDILKNDKTNKYYQKALEKLNYAVKYEEKTFTKIMTENTFFANSLINKLKEEGFEAYLDNVNNRTVYYGINEKIIKAEEKTLSKI